MELHITCDILPLVIFVMFKAILGNHVGINRCSYLPRIKYMGAIFRNKTNKP